MERYSTTEMTMKHLLEKLAPDLHAVFRLELALGNVVARVDEPAGSRSPFAIVFCQPLHKSEIYSKLELPTSVCWWESSDPHYEAEAGFVSDTSRHILAGPLK